MRLFEVYKNKIDSLKLKGQQPPQPASHIWEGWEQIGVTADQIEYHTCELCGYLSLDSLGISLLNNGETECAWCSQIIREVAA